MDLCLIEHFDSIKFSTYLKRLSPSLQDLADYIYHCAEKRRLYCPEISTRPDQITLTWKNESRSLSVIIFKDKKYIEYVLRDHTFHRTLNSLANEEAIRHMFLELSLFLND